MEWHDGFTLARRDLGEFLGSGFNKKAYALVQHPEFVGLIVKYNDRDEVKREIKAIDKLDKLGFPVAKILAVGKLDDPADYHHNDTVIVMERYAMSNRCEPKHYDKFFDVMNENTIHSLEAIRAKIQATKTCISDIQFLFRPTGEVVVADPIDVFEAEFPEGLNEGIKLCNRFVEAAQYVMAVRAGRTKRVKRVVCGYQRDLLDEVETWMTTKRE
jgi:hypothetical protein